MPSTPAFRAASGSRLHVVNTGEFELSVLTQDVAPAATLAAATPSMTMLTSLDEMRGAVNRVAAGAGQPIETRPQDTV